MNTWAKRIRDLQGKGFHLREIGLLIGLSTSGVSDLANNESDECRGPKGRQAVALDGLHRRFCPAEAAEVAALEQESTYGTG